MAETSSGNALRSPVVLVTLLLAAVSTAPYVAAFVAPPAGRAFVGYFWFDDDAYNYLSFVQQAEAGASIFHNKLVLEEHPAALVNLEWLAVGRISRLLGGRPLLAYRLFGLAALVALVAGIDRWLLASGLPGSHRLAALLLVTTAAGFGGVRFALGAPASRCLDLATGLFPILEILANPHFVAGTALLLWALLAHAAPFGGRQVAGAAGLGTVLALTRPYDLVVLVFVRTVVVAFTESPRQWWRHAVAMAALVPAAAYNYWVFYRQAAFAFYADAAYVFPSRSDLAWALGPATLVAAAALLSHHRPSPGGRPRGPATVARLHLAAWCGIAVMVFLLRPVQFSLQFLVGVGVPLLALAAVGLASWPVGWTVAAAAALSSTAVAGLWLMTQPSMPAYVPAEQLAMAWALRADCRPGDRLIAPADIGLWAGGFTACRAFTSHGIEPAHEERLGAVRAFYERGDPAGRAAFLERVCATHVVLPSARPATYWVDGRVRLQPVAVAGGADRGLAAYRVFSACTAR